MGVVVEPVAVGDADSVDPEDGATVVAAPSGKVYPGQHPLHSGATQVTADWLVVYLSPVKYISLGLSAPKGKLASRVKPRG